MLRPKRIRRSHIPMFERKGDPFISRGQFLVRMLRRLA